MNIIKYKFNIIILFLIVVNFVPDTIIFSQERHPYASDEPMPYPKLFNIPGITPARQIVFEPDGNTFYILTDSVGHFEIIKSSHFESGKWSSPKITEFCGKGHIETPSISPNGTKFYFSQNTPLNGTGNEDIYVMDKTAAGWSEPRNIGSIINNSSFEGSASSALNGNLYFLSRRSGIVKIYCAKWIDGKYGEPELLDNNVNISNPLELFIAPDESYILFGRFISTNNYGDIYISFRNNNSWTKARSIGPKINTNAQEGRPVVSPDGNYLFFSRANETNPSQVYQIDWKLLLDSLRSVSMPTEVESFNNANPDKFSLSQNFPNPFNPETVIGYQLPTISFVTLKVYDILGNEVAALVNKEQSAGNHEIKFNAGNFSSGIYLYKLDAGNYTKIKKMMLLR